MNTDSADKLFQARIEDMYSRCERNFCPVYSHFLDERQCAEAEVICRKMGGELLYSLWGGFEGASRKMLCVYNEYSEDFFMEDFPMKCLTFSYRKEYALTHRDFLGSFMGLMLRRDTIGDIVISEGTAQVLVSDTAARLIRSSVSKIGRVGVKIADDKPFSLEVKQEFDNIGGTVASLRLDCIVGLCAHVSREKAAQLIRNEKVTVNCFPAVSVSQELHEKDVISIRGSGRFILSDINGMTKKGRIHVGLRKYK